MSSDIFAGLPRAHFAFIATDVPWHYEVRSPKGESRTPQHHYRTMPLAAIKALPVGTLAAKNCLLAFWTTGPHLKAAFEVLEAWDFKYVGLGFVWIKTRRRHAKQWLTPSDLHFGMGYTTRHNAEIVLFAKRGAPKRLRRDVPEVIIEPVREHSRKPERFYERAERLYPGPRLDLFSREERQGWTAWGDQADYFEMPKLLLPRHAPTVSTSPTSPPPSSPSPAGPIPARPSPSAAD